MSKKIKVLVVDDDEPILDLLEYNLNKEGYEVKVASEGATGIKIASKFHPDLILLDIMMPNMDGVRNFSERLREIPQLSNTYILFSYS